MILNAQYNQLIKEQKAAIKTWDIKAINDINRKIFELRLKKAEQNKKLKDAARQKLYNKSAENYARKNM